MSDKDAISRMRDTIKRALGKIDNPEPQPPPEPTEGMVTSAEWQTRMQAEGRSATVEVEERERQERA